jgi:predicted Zn-dependent protease
MYAARSSGEVAGLVFVDPGDYSGSYEEIASNGKIEEAVKVIEFETESFPKDSNAFDTLGQAYNAAGQKQLASQAYKRSLELNPTNTNCIDMIQRLKQ